MSFESWKGYGDDSFQLVTRDKDGDWVNAAEMSIGVNRTKKVVGPWRPGYAVGTYGVDRASNTVWAVINYNGEFAVARDMGH